MRVAIGALSFLALTAALAEEAPKPPAKTEKPMCIDIPKFGSHIKDHVCMAADADKARERLEQLRMLSAAASTNSLNPVPAGQSTTTPMQ
jgi:hypothetical protein